jgi:uracil-DNA glycosylase
MCKTPALPELEMRIRACRLCRDQPEKNPLPHEPRPVLQVSTMARLLICGQAPGTRVHASGRPFTDRSGDRLRAWTGLSPAVFYDASQVAIVPMGFCFPGLDAKGSDLPPRPECAKKWHAEVFAAMPNVQLVLLVGQYAQRWHLGAACPATVTETVAAWARFQTSATGGPRYVPLPHPSWRNTGWLKRHPWFEADLLPDLKGQVQQLLSGGYGAGLASAEASHITDVE